MSVPQRDFIWQQGEDGIISLVYKRGEPAVAVDLTGYKVRMDVRNPSGLVVFTFNSDDIVGDGALDETGVEDNEAVLGSDGTITIEVPRSASLNDGALVPTIGTAVFYDIFLRDTNNKQRKILGGTITIESSQTKWT